MNKPQLLALLCFVGLTATAGVMKINQAPILRTGAPNESSCAGCHSGNVNNGPATINFNLPSDYIPGQTYTLTYEIDDSSFPNGRFGFTTTALDGNNLKAGDFTALNTTTTSLQVGNVQGNQRQYIGHKASSGSVNSWTYEWTAPPTDVGPVQFYVVGISADGNNSTSGDFSYLQSLTINPSVAPPVPPSAGFEITSPLCEERQIVFQDTSSGDIDTYAWDFGPNATPQTANTAGPHTVTYGQAGPQAVQLIVTGGTDADTSTTQIDISTNPAAPSIAYSNDSLIASGESGSYQWYFVLAGGSLDSIPNASDSVLVYADFYDLAQNSGLVQVSVKNTNDCATLSESFTLPFRTSIGNQLAGQAIKLYPNPTKDLLFIDYDYAGFAELEITLFSLEGKVLAKQQADFRAQNTVSISTAGIARGLYLLEVSHGEHKEVFKWRKE
ncbi:MAG: choice-of-anchor V domain-containing protein [Bacteroidota bacterium]